jgi:hypothetical protein
VSGERTLGLGPAGLNTRRRGLRRASGRTREPRGRGVVEKRGLGGLWARFAPGSAWASRTAGRQLEGGPRATPRLRPPQPRARPAGGFPVPRALCLARRRQPPTAGLRVTSTTSREPQGAGRQPRALLVPGGPSRACGERGRVRSPQRRSKTASPACGGAVSAALRGFVRRAHRVRAEGAGALGGAGMLQGTRSHKAGPARMSHAHRLLAGTGTLQLPRSPRLWGPGIERRAVEPADRWQAALVRRGRRGLSMGGRELEKRGQRPVQRRRSCGKRGQGGGCGRGQAAAKPVPAGLEARSGGGAPSKLLWEWRGPRGEKRGTSQEERVVRLEAALHAVCAF